MDQHEDAFLYFYLVRVKSFYMSYSVVTVVCDSVEVTDAFPALAKAFCEFFFPDTL